jgi:hypothetical protein
MLDAFIIEEIKRREGERGLEDRPVVELPVPQPPQPAQPVHRDDEPGDRDRGVVIIDYSAGGGAW